MDARVFGRWRHAQVVLGGCDGKTEVSRDAAWWMENQIGVVLVEKTRQSWSLSCVGARHASGEVRFSTERGPMVADAGTRASCPPLVGVVFGSHARELARGAHHRPPQPLTFPCHRHCLQLLGVCGAFRLPPRLPHESPQEVRSLVMGKHPREPAAGCFILCRRLNFPGPF